MVEFTNQLVPGSKVRINPALVDAIYEDAGSVGILMSSGITYTVPGTLDEVDNKLTAHYTDVRYLAFVIESLCTHLKVEMVPPKPQPDQES